MNKLKTPLRYPGGKSRVAEKIESYFPNLSNFDEFREPFLGGGSMAIHITKKYPDLSIWVNDLYEPLINFWKQLQISGVEMRERIVELRTTNKTLLSGLSLFNDSKEKINNKDVSDLERAIAFYIVNKCSFSGLTEKSTFTQQAYEQFTLLGIQRLSTFSDLIKNWKFSNDSYEVLLQDTNKAFVYLDPPYDIKSNLYGKDGLLHKNFDHKEFATNCKNSNLLQMISYNSNEAIKENFNDWNIYEFDFTYTLVSVGEYMKNQKSKIELLICNYDSTLRGQNE